MKPKPPPEPAPPREREKPRGRSGQPAAGNSTARWAGGVALVLMLYVLSTGPMLKLRMNGQVSDETFWDLYAPVGWICETKVGEACIMLPLLMYWDIVWGIHGDLCLAFGVRVTRWEIRSTM